MNFLSRMKLSLARFMEGRNGTDHLGMFTLFAGLIFSLTASFTGLWFLSWIGLFFYIVTLFRMFSRNKAKRTAENQKYLSATSHIRQFMKRLKNRKNYRYFRCPQCKVLLRLKKGSGEKDITCVRCGHQFHQKA